MGTNEQTEKGMQEIILVTKAIKRFPSVHPRKLRRLGFKQGKHAFVDCAVVRDHLREKKKRKRKPYPLSEAEYRTVRRIARFVFLRQWNLNQADREELYQDVALKVSRYYMPRKAALTTYTKRVAKTVLADFFKNKAKELRTLYGFSDEQLGRAYENYERWDIGGRVKPRGAGPDSDGWDTPSTSIDFLLKS